MWISLADVADNFLVFAWTDLEKKKQRDPSGLSAFIVERAFKGFSSGTLKEKWGILAGNTGFFKMDEVEVPEENLRRPPGEGFKIAMFALDQGRYTVAAGATGLIRACRDASAQLRARSGRPSASTIGRAPARQGDDRADGVRLSGVAAALAASGWLKNQGRRNTRETGLAKWFATVASERAAGDAVQVHGANGYSDEYPVGRFYRNCKGAVIYEGTREIHKLMQADYVLGYRVRTGRRAASCRRSTRRRVAHDDRTMRLRPLARIPPRRRTGGDRLRAHDGPGRSATSPTRRRSRRCGAPRHRADRRHDRHRRRRARRGADAVHRREGRDRREHGGGRRALPQGRHRRRSARRHEPVRTGAPNALAVLAASDAGGLLHAPDLYMEKLVVGPSAKHAVSLDAPVADNLRGDRRAASTATSRTWSSIVLDRPRHEQLIARDPRRPARASG